MSVCAHHERSDLELISGGSGWGEYRCRRCGVFGYVNWDGRWGGPVGVFVPFVFEDEQGRPRHQYRCLAAGVRGEPREERVAVPPGSGPRDVRHGDGWLSWRREGP